jgi:DNA-binding MarR family transcriptional regulator
MSVQAIAAAFRAVCPSSSAKLALLAISNFADEDGVAWPSQGRLAADTGLAERTVRRALEQLEEAGLIRREERRRRDGSRSSDLIFILAAQPANLAASRRDQPANLTGGGAMVTGGGVTVSGHEPSTKPSKNLKKESIVQSDPEGFALWWETYPRKAAKLKAVEAYRKTLAQGLATAEELLAGAQAYSSARAGQDAQFTKLPTSWLNQGCWADELAAPSPPRNGGGVAVRESGLGWAASRLASEAMQ